MEALPANNIAIVNSAGNVRMLKCFLTVSIGFMGSKLATSLEAKSFQKGTDQQYLEYGIVTIRILPGNGLSYNHYHHGLI